MADSSYRAVRWASPGPYRVVTAEVPAWATAGGRDIAVLARYPAPHGPHGPPAPHGPPEPGGRLRVVVLCHGLGGSHHGYAALGRHLAAHGYAVIHPQFLDSRPLASAALGLAAADEQAFASDERVRAMLFEPAHWMSRIERVRAVVGTLGTQRHLPVTLEPDRVIVAGHSYGAYTAQLLLGARLSGVGLDHESFAHPAVVGGLLASPQGSGDRGLTRRSWDAIGRPLAVLTGTDDLGPFGEGLAWRREPFDGAPGRPRHLAVVRGGDHSLGGIALADGEQPVLTRLARNDARQPAAAPAQVRAAVCAVAAAFADLIHGDAAAGDWLASGPFPEILEHEHRASPREAGAA